jgi:hypothetical protein
MRASRNDRAIGSQWPLAPSCAVNRMSSLGSAGHDVVELLGLPAEELLVFGIGDQQRGRDVLYLLAESVGRDRLIQVEAESPLNP